MNVDLNKLADQDKLAYAILDEFEVPGELVNFVPGYGNGHINDTYLVETELNGANTNYIFQRINPVVFPKAIEVMNNIALILPVLKAKAKERGQDVSRTTLTLLPTSQAKPYYVDAEGAVWRMYEFIKNSMSYEVLESAEQFKTVGEAFGSFQTDLAKFPAEQLSETIVKFHDTRNRYIQLEQACQKDPKQRLHEQEVQALLKQAETFKEEAAYLMTELEKGNLPLKVTHNDTKLNNVLFDRTRKEVLCVVDLDTVMPGLVAFDFGDAIRTGATSALEDEKDLSKVHFLPKMYFAFLDGFLTSCAKSLTEAEAVSLAHGALILPLETGVRFLTDYLNGDIYFKTAYLEHNLVRAKTQFKLVSEIADSLPMLISETKKRYHAYREE